MECFARRKEGRYGTFCRVCAPILLLNLAFRGPGDSTSLSLETSKTAFLVCSGFITSTYNSGTQVMKE